MTGATSGVHAKPGVQYQKSEDDDHFTVVGIDERGRACVQLEDGSPIRYSLTRRGTFLREDIEERSSKTDAGPGPMVARACPPTEHKFGDMEPISEDIGNYTETCGRCGLSYGVLLEHSDQDPKHSVTWNCRLCGDPFPGAEPNYEAISCPGPICSECWFEECDPASEHYLGVFPYAILICESGCSDDDPAMTYRVPDCGWIGRMTPEMTSRFLGDPPSPGESEFDIETDDCPACGHSEFRVAWRMPRWVKYLAVGRGVPPTSELATKDLFDEDEDHRIITADERAGIREGKTINTYRSRASSSCPIRERVPFGSLCRDDLPVHDVICERLPKATSYNWPHAPLAVGYERYNENNLRMASVSATRYLVIDTNDRAAPPDPLLDALADEGYHPLDGTHPSSSHDDGWPVTSLLDGATDLPQGMFVFMSLDD